MYIVTRMNEYTHFTSMGWILILLGTILVALPYLSRLIPNVEKIPWIILYVYKRDGFYFATSPILILLSILSFILNRNR